MKVADRFDYIIVGGGTSGAVLAARLSENPHVTVCLLEAGPDDRDVAAILDLKNWAQLEHSEYNVSFQVVNQEFANPRIRQPRARVLGGCSSHNGVIAFQTPTYDLLRWQELGAEGWGPEGTRASFARLFKTVKLERASTINQLANDFVAACESMGYAKTEFAKVDFKPGVDWFWLNKIGNIRQSSSIAYLHPVRDQRTNLKILTRVEVIKVLFNAKLEATAVATTNGVFEAGREIIICAGAIETPKLLMLSGVGASSHLERNEIQPIVDLPGVGENLQDHIESIVLWQSRHPIPQDTAQYWDAGLFAATANQVSADLMFHFGSCAFDTYTVPAGYPTAKDAFCLCPNVTRPKSRGSIRLQSRDFRKPPLIDFNYLADPGQEDLRLLYQGFQIARDIGRQTSLAKWVERELAPGPMVKDESAILEYIRRTSNSVYHPVGTCKIGSSSDKMSVVDSELRVRGVTRLRVADASVFPTMIGVNICMTCMMIGEKAADLIRGSDE